MCDDTMNTWWIVSPAVTCVSLFHASYNVQMQRSAFGADVYSFTKIPTVDPTVGPTIGLEHGLPWPLPASVRCSRVHAFERGQNTLSLCSVQAIPCGTPVRGFRLSEMLLQLCKSQCRGLCLGLGGSAMPFLKCLGHKGWQVQCFEAGDNERPRISAIGIPCCEQ